MGQPLTYGSIRQFYVPDQRTGRPTKHLPLSNFHKSEFTDRLGNVWKTSEHFYQAHKAMHDRDFVRIRDCGTPATAKRIGQTITIRSGWNMERLNVMRAALDLKFANGRPEAGFLLLTDGILEEGNTWGDTFWGVDLKTGKGSNWLGVLLMARREYLRNELDGDTPPKELTLFG